MLPYKSSERKPVWPQAAPALPQEQISSAQRLKYVPHIVQRQHYNNSPSQQHLFQLHQQHISARPLFFLSPTLQQTYQQQVCNGSFGFTGFPARSPSIATQYQPALPVHQSRGYLQQQPQQVLAPSGARNSCGSTEPPFSYRSAGSCSSAYAPAVPLPQRRDTILSISATNRNTSVYRWPLSHTRGNTTAYEWPRQARQGNTPVAAGDSSSSTRHKPTAGVPPSLTAAQYAGRRKDVVYVSAAGVSLMQQVPIATAGAIARDVAPATSATASSRAAGDLAAKQGFLMTGVAAPQILAATKALAVNGMEASTSNLLKETGQAVREEDRGIAKRASDPTEVVRFVEEKMLAPAVLHTSVPRKQLGFQAVPNTAANIISQEKLLDLSTERCASSHTPTPLSATPPSLGADVVSLRSFTISPAHGTVQPTRASKFSYVKELPSHGLLSTSISPQAATTAEAGAIEDITAHVRAESSTAGRGGSMSEIVAGKMPGMMTKEHKSEKFYTTTPMPSLLSQHFRQPQILKYTNNLKQQEGEMLSVHLADAKGLSISKIQQHQMQVPTGAARQHIQAFSPWQQKVCKRNGIARNNQAREYQSTSALPIQNSKYEEIPADDETVNRETYYEACCSGVLGTSPTGLFSLDITAMCRGHITSLQAARAALLQQEKKRLAFGSGLRELLAAEKEAQKLVDAARENAARRRRRVLDEVEAAQVSCRASHEEEWKISTKKVEEETAAARAQVEILVDNQLDRAQKGLPARQSTAVDFIIQKVLEIDTRCPLEALKRFSSPRRQLAFYEARISQKKQVVHHPPGDRLRQETDVIIWDDKGYAKVEHISADRRTSVTQLGSFWVRHQAKVQQHSDRPLVLLTTQRWPGEGGGEENEEERARAEREGSTSRFPPLRSLSEVQSTPTRSRGTKTGVSPSATKTQESDQKIDLPLSLKKDLESFARSAGPSKSDEGNK